MADINEDGGKRTVQAMPDSMRFRKANVAKESDWKQLVEATKVEFGGINCLVNNAGTTHRNKGGIHFCERTRVTQLMLITANPRGYGSRV